MPDTDPVRTVFEVDDRQVKTKFDEFERRLAGLERKKKSAAKGAFLGAAVGGAVGFVAGAASNNDAVNSTLNLLTNVLAATLLPIMVALLPVIKALTPALLALGEGIGKLTSFLVDKFGADAIGRTALGAYVGGKVAGPWGAVVGGAVAGAGPPYVEASAERNEAVTEAVEGWVGPTNRYPEGVQSSANTYQGTPGPISRDRLYGPSIE